MRPAQPATPCGPARHQKPANKLLNLIQFLVILQSQQNNMITLDDTDRELIALLREDARLPVATLAQKLKVARGTAQKRLTQLQSGGVLVGFTIRLKPHAEAHRIGALMSIAVEGKRAPEVLRALHGHPNVARLHSTNGRWGIVAELRADSLEAFDRVSGQIRPV